MRMIRFLVLGFMLVGIGVGVGCEKKQGTPTKSVVLPSDAKPESPPGPPPLGQPEKPPGKPMP